MPSDRLAQTTRAARSHVSRRFDAARPSASAGRLMNASAASHEHSDQLAAVDCPAPSAQSWLHPVAEEWPRAGKGGSEN